MAPSEDVAASSASLPQNVSISAFSTYSGAGEQERNLEDPGTAYTDLILGAQGWADASTVPEMEIAWTAWTGEVGLLASSLRLVLKTYRRHTAAL